MITKSNRKSGESPDGPVDAYMRISPLHQPLFNIFATQIRLERDLTLSLLEVLKSLHQNLSNTI